jgi:uncharacterized protein (DUF1697 family)
MARYAAFLRGMNLGGRRITNVELCRHVFELGFEDVASFRASGNVVFSAGGGEAIGALAQRIEDGLAAALGYDVPVFARTAAQVLAIAAHEPFQASAVEASAGKLQVALLSAKPSAKARKAALALASDEDRLAIHESELYWLPSGGMLDSALDLKAIVKLLGSTTMRTKGTMDQLAAKFFAD